MMIYKRENVYKFLIEDYINSIKSLQENLRTTESKKSAEMIRKQIEAYRNQLSALERNMLKSILLDTKK